MTAIVTIPDMPPAKWYALPSDADLLRILACGRGEGRFQLRWASTPTHEFPASGYRVFVEFGNPTSLDVDQVNLGRVSPLNAGAAYWLPDTHSWPAFSAAVAARAPALAPAFPDNTEEALEWLRPLLRVVDPRTPEADLPPLIIAAAEFVGESHRDDPDLTAAIWGFNEPAPLAALLATQGVVDLIIAYYRRQCVESLWGLALRVEYAAIIGVYDEYHAKTDTIPVRFHVIAHIAGIGWLRDATQWMDSMGNCAPTAPVVTAWIVPGITKHPEFALWPHWVPAAGLQRPPAGGTAAIADQYVPRFKTHAVGLTWNEPSERGLIHLGPYLYEVRRYEHGPSSVTSLTAPLFPTAGFATAHPGSYVTMREPNVNAYPDSPLNSNAGVAQFVDTRAQESPELEGWVSYQVWSINLFGRHSVTPGTTQIRVVDDIAPPPPLRIGRSVSLAEAPSGYVLPSTVSQVRVEVEIGWDHRTDFLAPDTAEFRVYAAWSHSISWVCTVTAVTIVSELRCRLTIDGGVPFAANELQGLRITLGGWEYTIKANSSGPGGYLETTTRSGAPPPTGGGIVISLTAVGAPLRQRVGVAARAARVAATVLASAPRGTNEQTFDIALEDGRAAATAIAAGSIYVHALRASYPIVSVSANSVVIDAATGSDEWDSWRALANADARVVGSPAILFPSVVIPVDIPRPSRFAVFGRLHIAVAAADDATYRADAVTVTAEDAALLNRGGNEGLQTPAPLIALLADALPASPSVVGYDSTTILWARPAADYDEVARYTLRWTAVSGGRYQIGRVLDAALALRDRGAFSSADRSFDPRSYDDGTLRTLAADANNEDLLVLRGPTVIVGGEYEDDIPGKNNARALYRIRTVDEVNRPGAWSDVIGPVHVPDITPPAMPGMLGAYAEAPRQITVRWTQHGLDDTHLFLVYRSESADGARDYRTMTLAVEAAIGDAALRDDGRGSLGWNDTSVVPGRRYYYRIRPVRRVLDPRDANGIAKHDLFGEQSAGAQGQPYADGPLAAPSIDRVAWDAATGEVTLAWTPGETYEQTTVLHRRAGSPSWRPLSVAIPGDAHTVTVALPAGARYELLVRAYGVGRTADSTTTQLETV